jgi:hypothetical protein
MLLIYLIIQLKLVLAALGKPLANSQSQLQIA